MREEHIGARIAAERRLRGLTQRQLADRVHVSPVWLRRSSAATGQQRRLSSLPSLAYSGSSKGGSLASPTSPATGPMMPFTT